jgi:Sulfotransferase domain
MGPRILESRPAIANENRFLTASLSAETITKSRGNSCSANQVKARGAEPKLTKPERKLMFSRKRRRIDKLDFIIAGTQKSGTSALHYHLDQHPNITMAHSEEAHMIDHPHRHFFDDENRFSRKVDYDFLHRGIKFKRQSLITGSCTPIYTYWRPAMGRIRNYHPQIKLIVLLRNPIDRAFSHWNMYRERNQESLGFLEAVKEEKNRIKEALPLQPRKCSYVDRGFYSEQLERVFRFFPRKQVHVIKFDDFRNKPREILAAVFDFLGVAQLETVANKQQNLIPYDRRITPAERRHLYEIYQSDISKLEALLNWDCSAWKEV